MNPSGLFIRVVVFTLVSFSLVIGASQPSKSQHDIGILYPGFGVRQVEGLTEETCLDGPPRGRSHHFQLERKMTIGITVYASPPNHSPDPAFYIPEVTRSRSKCPEYYENDENGEFDEEGNIKERDSFILEPGQYDLYVVNYWEGEDWENKNWIRYVVNIYECVPSGYFQCFPDPNSP